MKIIFNCAYFSFHKQYCQNIKKELEKLGHIAIITESRDTCRMNAKAIENYYIQNHSDADFTVLPDEACRTIGGKGIYINHALLPVLPENHKFKTGHSFYYAQDYKKNVELHSDYLFLPSQEIANIFTKELNINKSIKIVGFPKLDDIIVSRKNKKQNNQINIVYFPTGNWKKTMNSAHIINFDILNKMGNFICNGHPAIDKKNVNSTKLLEIADILITDYSSIGYDAIILNIPTIFIDSPHWKTDSYKSSLICETARNAGIRVTNMNELTQAIEKYKNNNSFLEDKRIYYGNLLSKYKENSSEIFIKELLKLL